MPKPNKENIISEIIIELTKGTTFDTCLKLNGTKWNLTRSTFIRRWKDANSRYAITQARAQKGMSDTTVSKTIEAAEIGLKSKITRQLEIQAFLDPSYRVEEIVGVDVKSGKVIRAMRTLTPTEIRNYHAELSKMDDSYTPTKVADVNPDGSAKEPQKVVMTDSQLDEFKKSIESKK